MMNNKDMMKKLVKAHGVDAVVMLAKHVEKEIQQEEAKWSSLISLYEYGAAGHRKAIEYPEWVDEILDRVTTEMGVDVVAHGSGKVKNLAITSKDFARYVIYTTNDDGEIFRDIIEVLLACPAWCKGYGITRFRMELVFHMLVLHRNAKGQVKTELKTLLSKYDQTSLKVLAALDDDYRGVLNREIQMIAYVEKQIIPVIGEKAKFNFAA